MSNQTEYTIVRLRVPPELKKQIEDAAEQNNRSQSAEMVDRLEKSFSEELNQNDQLDIFINVLEKLVPGMDINTTSNFLVELINTRKKQQSNN
ncbi:Arc family DNA-binding protein [Acinetobacter radioresistens]|uniref:Arc family DNA-binding protein n=1 Tax=Acinetobacter radioresistens TaxID=40216 RepID=UPI00200513D1|nr:Arc family DNA-binding protein [Acinetobacter radioresistens]MCK4089662.1 Arc family DNA-binding protein [Acinetobacter radioresistens]